MEVKTIHGIIEEISPYYKKRIEKKKKGLIDSVPESEHSLSYESYAETLEPIYYFIIDLMNDFGLSTEKLIDNFSSMPGGPHFSESGMKMARMQEEASKMMQSVGVLTRSILNIIYDLKEFKIRLQVYDDLKSKNENTSEAAKLSLKQIWLDKVDLQRSQGSIHAMTTGQLGFQTLRDAFLAVKDEKDVDKIDLNDRVKRILKPRILEFNLWLTQSEKELRKRYEIERTYLRSQVNNVKLYSRWVRPYLLAAQKLEMKEQGRNPYAVNAFNRTILELTLLGKSEMKVDDAALAGDLPQDFYKSRSLKGKRKYYSCVLVDFVFLAVPQQGNFIGKSEITFRAYALNEDELKKLNYELEKSDLGDVLSLIEGTTTESLDQMQEEINEFLEEKEDKEKEKSKDNSNPFMALIGGYDKKEGKKSDKKENKKDVIVKVDDWVEKEHVRPLAAKKASDTIFNLFDIYKKSHGMVSYT
ncbi:MAG: hypothetical protein WC584_00620 [Candidatus Pacearchaeota archaeon]